MYPQQRPHINRRKWVVFQCRSYGETRTKALMPHSLNSILDMMRAPTLTRTMFLSWSLRARTCIRMTLEKSVLGQANSFLCRVDTNIGAEAIKPKAPSSTRKGRESSTLYRRSSETSVSRLTKRPDWHVSGLSVSPSASKDCGGPSRKSLVNQLGSHRWSVSDMPVSSNLANCPGRTGRLK